MTLSTTRPTSTVADTSSSLNTSYPVPGQDNNSNGFRINFTAIRTGLAQADAEITALQQNAILVADLATSSEPFENDLLRSVIKNGSYATFDPIYYPGGPLTGDNNTINVETAPVQSASLSSDGTVLKFENWPASGVYASMKLLLTGTGATSVAITNSTTATFKPATGFAGQVTGGGSTITYPITTGKLEALDFWTVDGGVTIYVTSAGQF